VTRIASLFEPQSVAEIDDETLLQTLFASAAKELERPRARADWAASPFAALKGISPTVYGSMFERLVERWLGLCGVSCAPRSNSSCDRVIGGHPVEIKGATLTTSRSFIFNQIRDQDYEYCVLVGLEPDSASVWVESKENCWALAREQHGGRTADASRDTRQLTVTPGWIGPQTNGTLRCAVLALMALEAA